MSHFAHEKLQYGIICLLLLVSLAVGTLPISAEEAPAADTADRVEVYVIKSDIKQGTKISEDLIEKKSFKKLNIPSNALSDPSKIVGRYAVSDLNMGEYIYLAQTTSKAPAKLSNELLIREITESKEAFLKVTDYFPADTGKDVGPLIQKLIDKNPKKTIYFPDGEYIVSSPIITHSNGDKANALLLADGAVIKADKDNWQNITFKNIAYKPTGAAHTTEDLTASSVVALGGYMNEWMSDTYRVGSYYYLMGGTIDGNGVANGVSLEFGRESLVRNVKIVNFKQIGFEIPRGSAGQSSDMDVEDVVIIGNGNKNTVGMRIHAYDNTISGCRIYDCQTGVMNMGGGNIYRDVRVYFTAQDKYAITKDVENIIGFKDSEGDNFYLHCYTENCAIGYMLAENRLSNVDGCRAAWKMKTGQKQIAFSSSGKLLNNISNCSAEFYDASTVNYFADPNCLGSELRIEMPAMDMSLVDDTSFEKYVAGNILNLKLN